MGNSEIGRSASKWAYAKELALVIALYVFTAKLGFLLAIHPGNVTVLWPASGIAFAAVIFCGMRVLPGIWLGSFIANAWFFSQVPGMLPGLTATGIAGSALIALASTAQAALGGFLLRKFIGTNNALSNPHDAFKFVGVTGASCLVAPTIGVTALRLLHFVPLDAFRYTWVTWWAGDVVGVLVFTSFALTWHRPPDYLRDRWRVIELIRCVVVLVLLTEGLAFGQWSYFARQHFPFVYMFFPLMMWAAARFGSSGVTLYVVVIELLAVWGTRNGVGPFIRPSFNDSLLLLQGFIGMVALSGLSLAAVLLNWQNSREKLERFNQELEEQIAQRTIELKLTNQNLMVARDQAIEASNLKSAFVANISHELRTPLSGIIGATELLKDTATAADIGLINILHQSARSLHKIVNEVLDLSKLEAGKVVILDEPFNLIYLVQDVGRAMALEANPKNIVLKTSIDHRIPELVRGDPDRIRQTLRNLISNAIKFTEYGSVSVEAAVQAETDANVTVLFTIDDTGIGISEDEQRLLFHPFTQVDNSRTRKYGGTGLGLSICKLLVEMMGGEVGVRSTKDKGSTFWFTVPFERCIHAAASTGSVSPREVFDTGAAAGKLVLVVDDSAMIRALVIKKLASLGLNTHEASNGREAVELAGKQSYDLILMDCQMPEMDGFEATKQIRRMARADGLRIPIIALTAGAMDGDEERCLAADMDDYLTKPVSFNELAPKIVRWLVHETDEKKRSEPDSKRRQ